MNSFYPPLPCLSVRLHFFRNPKVLPQSTMKMHSIEEARSFTVHLTFQWNDKITCFGHYELKWNHHGVNLRPNKYPIYPKYTFCFRIATRFVALHLKIPLFFISIGREMDTSLKNSTICYEIDQLYWQELNFKCLYCFATKWIRTCWSTPWWQCR